MRVVDAPAGTMYDDSGPASTCEWPTISDFPAALSDGRIAAVGESIKYTIGPPALSDASAVAWNDTRYLPFAKRAIVACDATAPVAVIVPSPTREKLTYSSPVVKTVDGPVSCPALSPAGHSTRDSVYTVPATY